MFFLFVCISAELFLTFKNNTFESLIKWFTDISARDITAPTLLRRHYRARLLRALTLERINIIAHDTSADDICTEFFCLFFI